MKPAIKGLWDNPRLLAAKILDEIERKESFADALLDSSLKKAPEMDERDRALATALLYGALRKRNALDSQIYRAYGRPLKKLHPSLLNILRIGAFQVLFMDKIPESAAVNEAVNAARALGHAKAAGLVNALLRKIALDGFVLPENADEIEKTALERGFPRWIIEKWEKDEGREGAFAMARAFAEEPPLFLRVNTSKISLVDAKKSLEGFKEVGEGRFAPDSLWISGGGDARRTSLLKDGLAFAQGQSSQLVSLLLGPQKGWKILDACSAPGLKAADLALMMGDSGKITALDIHPHRVKAIAEIARRLGLSSIEALCADASSFQNDELFNAALVDAPCSGLGVLSRNPEKRWRLSPEKIAHFPELQSGILSNAAKMVKSGGVLVYATCTSAREENEGVVRGFLDGNPAWELESAGRFVPKELVTPEGFMKTFPLGPPQSRGEHLDGFFAARLKRRD